MSVCPLFSFLVITYNQEETIEAALSSALQQDYPNLEIIVCDDCSQDATFQIACKIAADYHGPHRVILHKNEQNLGIGANFEKAFSLSSGEWIFMAAGDDISLPNRCRLVEEAIAAFPEAAAIGSNYEVIDGVSNTLGYSHPENHLAPGAAIAWHRSVFTEFSPLSRELKVEDIPLLFRVFLLKRTYVKIPQVTIKYRIDGHSFTGQDRNTTLNVHKYRLKLDHISQVLIKFRREDMVYIQRTKNSLSDELYKRLEARLNWADSATEEDICRREAAIQLLEGSVCAKLAYLFGGGPICIQRNFLERLRLVLSNVGWLLAFKRWIFPLKSWSDGIKKSCVPELPEGGEPFIIDVECYLSKVDCDYVCADCTESFQKTFPESLHPLSQ